MWPVPSCESSRGAEAAGRQPKGFALPIFWRISGQPLHLLMGQTSQSALWAASVLTWFKIDLFIFGCAWSFLLCSGFVQLQRATVQLLSSCATRGYSLVAGFVLLIVMASLVMERGLY